MLNIIKEINTHQGTKLLIELDDKNQIEVAIFKYGGTEKNGIHICMPSQVGCPIGCKFCATTHSAISYGRNLFLIEMNEIIALAQESFPSNAPVDVLSFSGHGEPLLNYENVLKCIATHSESIMNTFITTVGIKEAIVEIMDTGRIPGQFFFSLHGSTDQQRHIVIPDLPFIANLNELKIFSKYLLSHRQRVTFNYMLAKENTSKESAYTLFSYLSDIGKVSIRFTPVFSNGYYVKKPKDEDLEEFLHIFSSLAEGSDVSWRRSNPMGSEIGIACGQMRASIRR